MKAIPLVCFLAAAGCSKSAPPKTDWSDTKRNTESLTAAGVTYTIEIPEGLPKAERDPSSWSSGSDLYDGVPRVITRISALAMPISEEAAMQETTLDPKTATFTRKEQRADGWALTVVEPDRSNIGVVRLAVIGGKVVKCAAAQISRGELPSYDKTKAMLEAICDSMKAK